MTTVAGFARELLALVHEQRSILGISDEECGALLHLIALALGDSEFTTRELIAVAESQQALQNSIGERSPKSLGRFFAREIEGRAVNGLMLIRLAPGPCGILWKVQRT